MRLRAVDPGFDPRGVLTARMSLQGERYATPEALTRFYEEGLSRIRSLPGVRAAAVVNGVPLERALNLNVDVLDGPEKIEDALTVSMEPLDDMLRAADLDLEVLVGQVQGGHSGEDAALVQIQVSTSGSTPTDDATLRANRILDRLDEVGGLFALRSLEDASVRLLLGAPWVCAPGYEAEVDDDVAGELGITAPDDALVLLVLNPADTLADTTVNQMAPVVVNAGTGRGAQVVQAHRDLPLRAPFGG